MNLSTKYTATLIAFLSATSGVNAGCADSDGPGTTLGKEAAKLIVEGSDWFEQNCLSPMTVLPPHIDDAEAECKQFAINYCIGNMNKAVEAFNCHGTPTTDLLNSWATECYDEVSSLIPTPSPSPNPTSYRCKWDSDCGQGMKCKYNMCVDKQKNYGCKWDSDCGHGQECKHNMCVDKQKNYGCTTNLECGQHMKCKNNMCMPKASESRALRGSNE